MLDIRSDPAFLSDAIRDEAERLAGTHGDFAQRAAVCHHLYSHSSGNHAYALIAAHFSLAAERYLRRLRRAAELLKWEHLAPARRRRRMEALARLEEIVAAADRRGFVASYHAYRLAQHSHAHPALCRILPTTLATQIDNCHMARRLGQSLSSEERRSLFMSWAEWQQRAVVGPFITSALADFDPEPLGKLHPLLRLRYFSRRDSLQIEGVADDGERINVALQAFDLAERAGWKKVEASLRSSPVMPAPFQHNSGQHFFGMQNRARRMLRQEFLAAC